MGLAAKVSTLMDSGAGGDDSRESYSQRPSSMVRNSISSKSFSSPAAVQPPAAPVDSDDEV